MRGKSIGPVILPMVHDDPEVCFDFLVNMLGLSIGLGVICCGQSGFDSCHNQFPQK